MDSKNLLSNLYDYGDKIIVKSDVPKNYHPGDCGSVCGSRTVNNLEIAAQFKQSKPFQMYLIEFENGDSLEIPVFFLLPF